MICFWRRKCALLCSFWTNSILAWVFLWNDKCGWSFQVDWLSASILSFASKSNSHRISISKSLYFRSLNIAVFSADRPNIFCVPIGGIVTVPCPNHSSEDVKFNLLKDGTKIKEHECTSGNTSNSQASTDTAGVKSKGAENPFNFTLTVVNASSHGLYRCEGTILFPPPLRTLTTTPEVLLLIEGNYYSGSERKYWVFQPI